MVTFNGNRYVYSRFCNTFKYSNNYIKLTLEDVLNNCFVNYNTNMSKILFKFNVKTNFNILSGNKTFVLNSVYMALFNFFKCGSKITNIIISNKYLIIINNNICLQRNLI